MKVIGIAANTDHTILEVSRSELKALKMLSFVSDGGDPVNGSPFWQFTEHSLPDGDLTNPLNAVVQWSNLQGEANRLRDLADDIEAAIHKKAAQ